MVVMLKGIKQAARDLLDWSLTVGRAQRITEEYTLHYQFSDSTLNAEWDRAGADRLYDPV